jgi:RNA polymerase primary sigma factor
MAKASRRGEFEELDRYLRSLPRYEPLTREAERDLANRARRGDTGARDELIRRNLAFVVSIARRHMGRGARLDDLIQEGNIGLLKAVEKFDTGKGTRFSTYAIWWIRAYIQKYLKESHSSVRGGEDGARRGLRDVSLDVPLDEDGDTTALDRILDNDPGAEQRFLRGEVGRNVRASLEKARGRIGEMGWSIVAERLESDEPKTLEQLGKRFGVSRERVRQVELKTRSFLREYLQEFDEAA